MRSPILDLLMLIGGLVSIAGSYSMMKNAKSKLSQGQVSQEGLTNDEKKQGLYICDFKPDLGGNNSLLWMEEIFSAKSEKCQQYIFDGFRALAHFKLFVRMAGRTFRKRLDNR